MDQRWPELWALETRPHLVLPCRVDPTGLLGPTRAESRGSKWRWVSHGRFAPSFVELTTEQRILEAACLLPAYGAVTGWAGLNWEGATRWFDGTTPSGTERPVCLATAGDDIRPQPGVQVCAERLDPRDLILVDGISLTTSVRSPASRCATRAMSVRRP
jgi:hypothetical protein